MNQTENRDDEKTFRFQRRASDSEGGLLGGGGGGGGGGCFWRSFDRRSEIATASFSDWSSVGDDAVSVSVAGSLEAILSEVF